jgi:hypothetical protein
MYRVNKGDRGGGHFTHDERKEQEDEGNEIII